MSCVLRGAAWASLLLWLLLVTPAMAAEAPRMEIDAVLARLSDPGVMVVDIRGKDHVTYDGGRIIAGATLVEPREVTAWAARQDPSLLYILYCACPEEKTSARFVMQVREMGLNAVALLGGYTQWLERGLPTEPYTP